jgi:hypothetical protein
VGAGLAADQRLLEDVHGLRQHRPPPAERCQQRGQPRRARVVAEDVLLQVEPVPDLAQWGLF